MSKEAMKLALEALHGSIAITMAKIDLRNKAIKALEEALAKQEHDLQDTRCECCGYMTYQREHMGCIRSAKQEQSEPIQVTIQDFVKTVEGKENLMGKPRIWAQWPFEE
jgi:hypothetical protein